MLIGMRKKVDICWLLYIGMIFDHENGKINYSQERKKKRGSHIFVFYVDLDCRLRKME